MTDSQSSVYFAQAEARPLSPIKIGTSMNVQRRLQDLQVGHPFKLVILIVMPGDRSTEVAIHARFASARLEGDWFEPTAELLRFLSHGDHMAGTSAAVMRPAAPDRLLDAREIADVLGVTRRWVYDHADDLCAIRLGGPRGRIRFDLDATRESLASAGDRLRFERDPRDRLVATRRRRSDPVPNVRVGRLSDRLGISVSHDPAGDRYV
jgi:hypothetical protein